MPKQPEDHKPAKGSPFSFQAGGKSYTLPSAAKGRAALTGRDLRDAAIGGEAGQLAYLFKALEASKPSKAALDALYDLPQDGLLQVLNDWAEYGDGDGASLGES